MTAFSMIFRRFPKIFQIVPKARRTFPNIFREFPKISEDFRRLPKTFEEDRKYKLRDKLDVSEIIDIFICEDIISSHLTIIRLRRSEYLVNKPLPAAGISADNVRGWEIVRKMNIWPRSEASRANVKFWGQSLSQGHYQPIYQQAGKGFIYFITLPLIFSAIKPCVNMVKKPVVIWWRMRAWLTWGSKSKFDWFN